VGRETWEGGQVWAALAKEKLTTRKSVFPLTGSNIATIPSEKNLSRIASARALFFLKVFVFPAICQHFRRRFLLGKSRLHELVSLSLAGHEGQCAS
jgi:hypothetical protein